MSGLYQQPILLQWLASLTLAIIGFYAALIVIVSAYSNPIYYLLLVFYVPVGQFCFTPLFRLTGIYTYYSPMLLGYMANSRNIDLHFGTSFDYLLVIISPKERTQIKGILFVHFLEGLLHIIELIERGRLPITVQIQGTSYFFNERKLKKFGFRSAPVSLLHRANLIVNFIDLIWMYSLKKGKPAFPSILKVKRASISGESLVLNKKRISELNAVLSDRLSRSNIPS